jgi:hypothetical protein
MANKKGQGRKKGSFSFVPVSVKEMIAANPNQDFKWLLSAKQAAQLGINGKTANVISLNKKLAGQITTEETVPLVQVIEL